MSFRRRQSEKRNPFATRTRQTRRTARGSAVLAKNAVFYELYLELDMRSRAPIIYVTLRRSVLRRA
jgi:hypothetical protein